MDRRRTAIRWNQGCPIGVLVLGTIGILMPVACPPAKEHGKAKAPDSDPSLAIGGTYTMGVRVGIPRTLWYFTYAPFWETFFHELGAESVVSPATTKATGRPFPAIV